MDRKRLPETRGAIIHKGKVAGVKFYITVGLFEDGRPGELFVKCDKSEYSVWTNSISIMVSLALQSGVSIDSIVSKLESQRGTPSGMTGNPQIPFATSIVDYIARWLGYTFIPEYKKDANTVSKPATA